MRASNKYRGTCCRCHKPVEARKGTVARGRVYHLECEAEHRREIVSLNGPMNRPRRRIFYPGADQTGSKAYNRRKS